MFRRAASHNLDGTSVCLWVLSMAHAGRLQASAQQKAATSPPSPASFDQAMLLRTFCVRCHNQQLRTADLALDTVDLANVGRDAEILERVVQKLHTGAMPPPGLPRPDQLTTDAFVSLLEAELDRTAELHPNPGRTESLHRSNRRYQNATATRRRSTSTPLCRCCRRRRYSRSDNMAGLLSVPASGTLPGAAWKISRLALLNCRGRSRNLRVPDLAPQDGQVSELPFGSRWIAVHHISR